MGAPPAVHSAALLKDRGFKIIGAVVLDVVEGLFCAHLVPRPRSY